MEKLEVSLSILSLSAQGTTAVIAAFLIIVLFVGLCLKK